MMWFIDEMGLEMFCIEVVLCMLMGDLVCGVEVDFID